MDLLFTRYASPFLLVDELILTNSLSGYIDELFTIISEEKQEQTMWEFFLHKVYDKTWKEFCKETKIPNDTKDIDLGETVLKSKKMLSNFTPTS